MRVLSSDDKKFLVRTYDYRAYSRSGDFQDPAAGRVQRLERLYLQLQKISRQEPTDHEQRVLVVKRWFRPPAVMDAPPLTAWKDRMAEAQALFDEAYLETKTFLESHVYADKQLLRELDKHRRQLEEQRLEYDQIVQERADQNRKETAHKDAEADAQAQDAKKWSRDEFARVRRLNLGQSDFHDYLERKDRRWRESMG